MIQQCKIYILLTLSGHGDLECHDKFQLLKLKKSSIALFIKVFWLICVCLTERTEAVAEEGRPEGQVSNRLFHWRVEYLELSLTVWR